MTNWHVLCDFDGTIAGEDVIDVLLAEFGESGWAELENRWRSGAIGSRECLAGQTALLAMDRQQFEAHLEEVAIDPDFPAFVSLLASRRVPLAIVSDGFGEAIRYILSHHGLPPLEVVANRIVADGARWRLESPNAVDGCSSGTCKCRRAAQAAGAHVLMIGDGRSDFCVSGKADFVFAKGALAVHCRNASLPHVEVSDFGQINQLLPILLRYGPDATIETARLGMNVQPLERRLHA